MKNVDFRKLIHGWNLIDNFIYTCALLMYKELSNSFIYKDIGIDKNYYTVSLFVYGLFANLLKNKRLSDSKYFYMIPGKRYRTQKKPLITNVTSGF